jgi:hypothetical protein
MSKKTSVILLLLLSFAVMLYIISCASSPGGGSSGGQSSSASADVTLSFQSPVTNGGTGAVGDSNLTIAGQAEDTTGGSITNVQVVFNNQTNQASFSGTTNVYWTNQLVLLEGTNQISAFALSDSGKKSAVQSIQVIYTSLVGKFDSALFDTNVFGN